MNGLVLALDAGNTKSYPGSGTAWTDLSGIGNNGTLVNGPAYISENGGSLQFNGTTKYVNCGTSNSLNFTSSFSVSFWMKSIIGSGFGYFISRWTYSTGNYRQWSFDNRLTESTFSANRISFSISGNGTDAGTTIIGLADALYSNRWHNICGTWNGSIMILYVDGVLVAGPTTKTSMVSTPNQPTYIGAGDSGGFTMNGLMAQASVYNRALTAAEISQNFNALRGRYGI
jgi:hypothetical protein